MHFTPCLVRTKHKTSFSTYLVISPQHQLEDKGLKCNVDLNWYVASKNSHGRSKAFLSVLSIFWWFCLALKHSITFLNIIIKSDFDRFMTVLDRSNLLGRLRNGLERS